jgi:carboxymethylenebutenolidase
MGFCMGGALTLASASKINGWHSASPFYGIPDLNKYKLSNIKCPVLAHFGGDDNMMGFSDP